MAFGKKLIDEFKPKKEHNFMKGLWDWAKSPGGIATIILFIAVVALIEHKTAKK